MSAINYTGAGVGMSFGSDEEITDVYTDQRFPLMTVREEDGRVYRFVKYTAGTATVTAVAGNLVYWTGTHGTVVGDESDSLVPAGFLQAVIADTGHGWILVRGLATVNTDGADDITAGMPILSSTTDGKVNGLVAAQFTTTAGTLAQEVRIVRGYVGNALAADSDANNNVLAMICIE